MNFLADQVASDESSYVTVRKKLKCPGFLYLIICGYRVPILLWMVAFLPHTSLLSDNQRCRHPPVSSELHRKNGMDINQLTKKLRLLNDEPFLQVFFEASDMQSVIDSPIVILQMINVHWDQLDQSEPGVHD